MCSLRLMEWIQLVQVNYPFGKEKIRTKGLIAGMCKEVLNSRNLSFYQVLVKLDEFGRDMGKDPNYRTLVSFMHENDLKKFTEYIKNFPQDSTFERSFIFSALLEEACSIRDRDEFARYLITVIAAIDVNFCNPHCDGRTALHHVVASENAHKHGWLRQLLEYDDIEVNMQDDFGDTALHLACKNCNVIAFKMLFKNKGLDIRLRNTNDRTALHIALANEYKFIVWKLLKRARFGMDFRSKEMLQNRLVEMNFLIEAFQSLKMEDLKRFFQLFKEKRLRSPNEDNGQYTLLQYASKKGLHDAVQFLVEIGAQLNRICPGEAGNKVPPFFLAGERGYFKVLQVFIDHDNLLEEFHPRKRIVSFTNRSVKNSTNRKRLSYHHKDTVRDETILLTVLRGYAQATTESKKEDHSRRSLMKRKRLPFLGPDRDYEKCVTILLTKNKNRGSGASRKRRFDVNRRNKDGDTALNYAYTHLRNERLTNLLFQHGAHVWGGLTLRNLYDEDDFGVIKYFDHKVIKQFLDGKVNDDDNGDHNVHNPKSDLFYISYDYGFLLPPFYADHLSANAENKANKFLETKLLLEMSKVEGLKHLLTHPVLSSFLQLKWYLIRTYYWLNIIFYSAFCFFLTWSIILIDNDNASQPNVKYPESSFPDTWILWTTYVLISLLILREMFQLFVSPRSYMRNLENLLEILIIMTSLVSVVSGNWLGSDIEPSEINSIHAVTILLSWTELILLIGRHPYFSTNVEMLKVICTKSFNFFVWYLLLSCGFAFTFYSLFKDKQNCKQVHYVSGKTVNKNCTSTTFPSPMMSVFKVIVMSVGEFNANDLPFDQVPGVSHLIFLLFVFLMVITFVNLFIGLAVSDINQIQKNAQLIELIRRVELINFLENLANKSDLFTQLGRANEWFTSRLNMLKKKEIEDKRVIQGKSFRLFYKGVNLYSEMDGRTKVFVYPNVNNVVDFTEAKLTGDHTMSRMHKGDKRGWRIHGSTVEESMRILRRKKLETTQVSLQQIQQEMKEEKVMLQKFQDSLRRDRKTALRRFHIEILAKRFYEKICQEREFILREVHKDIELSTEVIYTKVGMIEKKMSA